MINDQTNMTALLTIDAILARLTATETPLDDYLRDLADFDATTDDALLDDDIILNLTRALLHAYPINTDSDLDDLTDYFNYRAETAD